MKALTPARQDILLRRYEFSRRGVIRVQAVRETEDLLKLAGFKKPLRFDWYDVPVRENDHGQLVVDVPSPGQPPVAPVAQPEAQPGEAPSEKSKLAPALGFDDPGTTMQRLIERAVAFRRAWPTRGGLLMKARKWIKLMGYQDPSRWEKKFIAMARRFQGQVFRAGNQAYVFRSVQRGGDAFYEILPARVIEGRFRVELRVEETWLTTLIVDAVSEEAAGLAAIEIAIGKDPMLSYDVWSVTPENLAVEDEQASTPGVSPGSGADSATRGGSRFPSDPGLARTSSPAFSTVNWIRSAANRRRRFRVPVSDDQYVEVEISDRGGQCFVEGAGADWKEPRLEDAPILAAIATLHRCRDLADYEVSNA